MGESVLDLLSDASETDGCFRFTKDGTLSVSVPSRDVWKASERSRRHLASKTERSESVAMVLTNSLASLATLVGGWRAGLEVSSLPRRPGAQSVTDYRADLQAVCGSLQTRILVVDESLKPTVSGLGLEILSFEECLEGGPDTHSDETGSFVQFSSGTTGLPKGVRLSLGAIAANIVGLIETMGNDPQVSCSWLPLSHDMGLIGMCLGSWALHAKRWAGTGQTILMNTEAFVARPTTWLKLCSESQATVTSGSNYAFELITWRQPSSSLDLKSLKTTIVGAEPVRASTLRKLETALRGSGFDPRSLCPAYGLAEATLAVTIVRPEEHWHAVLVNHAELADDVWCPAEEGTEVVGVGRPIQGVEVRIGDRRQLGEILVKSPAVCSGYATSRETPVMGDWLHTGDIGHIAGDVLYVTGRMDDNFFVSGRVLNASLIEASIDSGIARPQAIAVVPDYDGRYSVLIERRRSLPRPQLPAVAAELRRSLSLRFGSGPSSIMFVSRGSLVRTASGKLHRKKLSAALVSDDIDVEYRRDFASR